MLRTPLILIVVVLFAPLLAQAQTATPPNVPPLPEHYDSAFALFPEAINRGVIDDTTTAHTYLVLAAAGDVIEVSVSRLDGDLIPMLTLLDVNGNILVEQFSVDLMGRTAEITFPVDAASWLYLVVERDLSNPTGTGTYEIRLTGVTDLLGAWLNAVSDILLPEETTATGVAAPLLGDLVTPTFTPSLTPTNTLTRTPTPTFTLTPTETYTPSPTLTPSETPSPSLTPTPSDTPSLTPTSTLTPTPSDTALPTLTPIATKTPFPTNTPTPLPTATYTPTRTPTDTPRPTATFTRTRPPSSTPRPTDTPVISAPRALVVGSSLDAYLYANSSDYWTFYGYAGDTVRINMDAEFDTYLYLYDPGDALVESNDDSNGSLNSEITYTLPTSGTYTIEARGFSTGASGSYTIALNTVSSNGGGDSFGDLATIAYGDQVSGVLSLGERETWTFNGTQGDTISIFLFSEDFDSYVYLYSASDMLLSYDDDTGGELDSSLTYTLPYTGQYSIVAASFSDRGAGSYLLYLWLEAAGASSSVPQLSYGDSVNGTLEIGGSDTWTFSGTAGDVVTIFLYSLDFDSYVYLYNPSDVLVLQDDDSGGDLDSLISGYILPSSGTYTIVATSFRENGGGDYLLELTRVSSSGSSGGSAVAGTCGGHRTLFTAGDIAVVDFNSSGALRILTNYEGGARQTLAQAYDNNQLELLEGPICYSGSWYWRARLTTRDVTGWVAENDETYRWLCPYDDPECT
jgi:hypothetical protein